MLEVRATARAPLFIGAAPQTGNLIPGQPIVPGPVLRGALAAHWIRQNGTPAADDREFAATFDESVRFGPLVPDGVVLEPVSVRRCKYLATDECHTQIADLLAGDPGHTTCPTCGHPREVGKGRWLATPRETYTRTSLNEDETAARSQLYSREAIPRGTRLTGHITNPSPWLRSLERLTVWFGGRRTVAGRTELALREVPDPSPPVRDPATELTLVLHSPGVFVDPRTMPLLELPPDEIARGLGVPASTVEVEQQWVRVERVTGWNAAAGMAKPEDPALAPGSAARVHLTRPATSEQLTRLATSGLGLRRSEGMGWVEINPPRWAPPPPPAADHDRHTQPAVTAILEITRDSDLRHWLHDTLHEQAELAEIDQPTPVDHILARRRDLRYAARDLRDRVKRLFTSAPTAEGLREMADQLKGAP